MDELSMITVQTQLKVGLCQKILLPGFTNGRLSTSIDELKSLETTYSCEAKTNTDRR